MDDAAFRRDRLLENVYGPDYKGNEGLRHLLDGIEQINREVGTRYSAT
jgi:DNA (cytosine-5)-methyltransferase 1